MATTFLDVLLKFEPVARTDRHRLAGVVTVDGQYAEKRIHVHLRSTMELVAATYSDPVTGEWEIFGLPEYPEGSLIVIAFDNTGTYNAEVADYVSQVTGEGV